MNIKLKNKFLYFDNYKLRCAIGKRGITDNKKEGDKKTPKGTFRLKYILFRKDKISKLKSSLKIKKITKNIGWCDDSNSKYYNKLVKLPFNGGVEKLWLKQNIYDVVVVLDYNLKPVIKNKGSAIFLHLAKKNYLPTKGCVAVSKKHMMLMISKINRKSKLIII
jgi:L,D-peptidoglycan transpeptidase YkuD (ErfK/YbiS/YcfS/YnhG family)